MNAENMAANLDTVPVVFEAAPTAAVGGKLAALTARHADPAQKIQSRFNLRCGPDYRQSRPIGLLEVRSGSNGGGRHG